MERKLELAYICMYLPYGLKAIANECEIVNIVELSANGMVGFNSELGYDRWDIRFFKPILRPMSDLTKPMTHPDVNGGEEFVPLIFLTKEITNQDVSIIDEWNLYSDHIWVHYEYDGGKKESCLINFFIYALPLFNQLHFDYNDLIGQGLAIDINTTTL